MRAKVINPTTEGRCTFYDVEKSPDIIPCTCPWTDRPTDPVVKKSSEAVDGSGDGRTDWSSESLSFGLTRTGLG